MIKWKTDTFSGLNNFQEISFKDLIELYKKQSNLLIEDGYKLSTKSSPITIRKKTGNKVVFDNAGYEKEMQNGLLNIISLDLSNKSYPNDFYENGSFIFYKVPNRILRKMTSHLHQPSIRIINKFFEEVDWDGDWKSLMNEYDKKYPQKHITNKKEGEYSWRANFSIDWWVSLKKEGLINPVVLGKNELLFLRGSHRCFMLGKLGWDMPVFIPNTQNPIKKMTNFYFYENEQLSLVIENQKDYWYYRDTLI